MSTKLMAAVWPLQMPSSAKAVLISLADNANDDGHCFPSITTIGERVCLGRTAVIDAVKWLEQHGALTADRSNGRHTTYQLTPASFVNQSAKRTGQAATKAPDRSAKQTGPQAAPVRQTDGTGPESGRDQSAKRTLTVKEPSSNRKAEEGAYPRPPGVGEDHWRDWLRVRRGRNKPVTPTVMAGLEREAAKAGIDLPSAVRICAERSWLSFNAAWDWKPNAPRASPAATERSTYLSGLTSRTAIQPTDDPRIIDVDFDQPATPRLAAGRG